MPQRGAQDALCAVAARRGLGGEREPREPPAAPDLLHEIEVLHHRHLRDAPDLAQHAAAREERLVAVGQPEPPGAQPGAPLDQSERSAALVEAQPEAAARHARVAQRVGHGVGVSGGKARVGVQEEHGIASRRLEAGSQLAGAPATRIQHPRTRSACARQRGVPAAAVHDQDLHTGRASTLDGGADAGFLIEGRDHHRQAHRPTIAPAPAPTLTAPTALPIPRPVKPAGGRPPSSKPGPQRAGAASRSAAKPAASPPASAPLYSATGVDLDRDEGLVSDIAEITRTTLRPEVLSSIGGFAGLFKAPDRYKNPIFVACTDGVGTKLKLAAQLGRYDTVGIDCVAMVVNDMIVQGAEPIVFLDYVAMESLDPETVRQVLRGIAEGCRRAGCALLGGESASMPGVYPKGEIELVGFGVGIVEREGVIDGSGVSQGDWILGIASSGFHSNGYSLVRSVVDAALAGGRVELRADHPALNGSLASALLAPTRIYVKPILHLLREFTVKGMVHVTGGGFPGNVPRVLPKSVRARIDPQAWPRPPVFGLVQELGGIPEDEMLRVFNCGIGMLLIVRREQARDVIERLQALGERAYVVGEIEAKSPDDAPLLLDPGSQPG